jgi:nicotinate-nucleotide pyrophosphorylase (carboxylating)
VSHAPGSFSSGAVGRDPTDDSPPVAEIEAIVERALAEDIGSGDLTAGLLDAQRRETAEVVLKEQAVLCGTAWFDAVFRRLDASIEIEWRHRDGTLLEPGTVVCRLAGPVRPLLSGERTALNLLQTLTGTATAARRYAAAVEGTGARILDTRKTLPGLRAAQKYAVRCGGAVNHRQGLYDAVLIKENHIAAHGTVAETVRLAHALADEVLVEVEVENLDQAREALETGADRLLLDNFTRPMLRAAVALRDAHGGPRKELEASGGIELASVREIAATGVDWISVGAITKDLDAADFSLRIV